MRMTNEQIDFLSTLTPEEQELFNLVLKDLNCIPGTEIQYDVGCIAIATIKGYRLDNAYKRAMSIV